VAKYQPIACALHDEYELAIMHKKILSLKWLDDNGNEHQERVLPADIIARDGAEYLLVKRPGDEAQLFIRLDRIKAF